MSGIGAAHAYNLTRQKAGADLTWSSQAVSGFLLETILLYLAVAHFGRGRGDWEESESPEFWKKAVIIDTKLALLCVREKTGQSVAFLQI